MPLPPTKAYNHASILTNGTDHTSVPGISMEAAHSGAMNTTKTTEPVITMVPKSWLQTPMSLEYFWTFRDDVKAHGTAAENLALKLIQQLLLSPANGVSETCLANVSHTLSALPHLTTNTRGAFIPIALYPPALRTLLLRPVRQLFSTVYVNHIVSKEGLTRNATFHSSRDQRVASPSSSHRDVDVAMEQLVDNIRYCFEKVVVPDNRVTDNHPSTHLWRGRPDRHQTGSILSAKETDWLDTVCIDELYRRIIAFMHVNLTGPRLD